MVKDIFCLLSEIKYEFMRNAKCNMKPNKVVQVQCEGASRCSVGIAGRERDKGSG